MTDAYTTYAQEAYWGSSSSAVSLGAVVTGAPIAGEAQVTRRSVLNAQYPRLVPTRADYRVTIPQLLIGDESEAMRAAPEATLAVIQTDAATALVMPALIAGIPKQAEAGGEIVSNLNVQPRGGAVRAKATALAGKAITVASTDEVYVVVTSGSGTVTRGSASFTAAGKVAIAHLSDSGTSVVPAAGVKGWLLSGPVATV
ncbi:hypothetical protein [Candidatus Poriferisocius sp.]|uniref:hypothetical protein n=1 Tax=Candidatus Poriferisocius sp. TaxID=3101276 RepID=UPI003B52F8FA